MVGRRLLGPCQTRLQLTSGPGGMGVAFGSCGCVACVHDHTNTHKKPCISMSDVACPCCFGRRGNEKALPPSEEHEALEQSYATALADAVSAPRYICDLVQVLHLQVQSGAVRRQAAAHMVSRRQLLATGFPFPVCFLKAVVQEIGHVHKPECRCIDLVLSWGCCPSVVASDGVRILTPFAFCVTMWQPQKTIQALLAYGCLPWALRNEQPPCWTAPITTRCVIDVRAAQMQWARWHGRLCRRLWVMCMH